MSSTINQPSSVTIKQNSKTITLNTAGNINASGSAYAFTANVTTSSWQPLTTGSANPLRYGVFTNNSSTIVGSGSVIVIGIGSQINSIILWPDDSAIIPHSASVSLYACATGSQGTVQLDYTLINGY
jgi:hypothetical protein